MGNPNVQQALSLEDATLDLGGIGDCGYRAMMGAILAKRRLGKLSPEQLQSVGLRDTLDLFSRLGAAYLPKGLQNLSIEDQLDRTIELLQTNQRQKVILDLAEAARLVADATFRHHPKFARFRVTDFTAIPNEDADLVHRAHDQHTYIDAGRIAAFSLATQTPIIVHNDRGVKNEEYNPANALSAPIQISLRKNHYTAKVDAESARVLSMSSPSKPVSNFETQSANPVTRPVRDFSMFTFRSVDQATQVLLDDQFYARQRENIRDLLTQSNPTQQQLESIFNKFKATDGYLKGKTMTSREDALYFISVAAWTNPEVASAVRDALNPAHAKLLGDEMIEQNKYSVSRMVR